jgi:hypothetical protein
VVKFAGQYAGWFDPRAWRLLVVLLVCGVAVAEVPLAPHVAEYKVKINVLGGRLDTKLQASENGFVATHTIRPTGLSRMISRGSIEETSAFVTAGGGIRPRRYSTKDTITSDRESVDIEFDWSTGEARGTVNGEPVTSTMSAIAHDRVSIQYELMHDLLNDGPSEEYVLFDVDRLKTVSVRNIGEKTIKVPAGRYNVVGIQHQALNSKRVTTLWCAKELGYLPVVIEQHRKGKLRVRASLTRYEPAQ